MDSQEALRKVLQFHRNYLSSGEPDGKYPVSAFEEVLNAMGTLAQQAQQQAPPAPVRPSGDSIHINDAVYGEGVTHEVERNSRGNTIRVKVNSVTRGTETLAETQARSFEVLKKAMADMERDFPRTVKGE
jgi:hypothetical protein